jgi:formylglycine-generating enzyme required for sulfatase activity
MDTQPQSRHSRAQFAILALFAFAPLHLASTGDSYCVECPAMIVLPRLNGASNQIAVSETPITVTQWERCIDDGGCNGYRPDRRGPSRQAPVVNVSYNDARAYLAWLSKKTGARYRLLREDEWALVALGGRSTRFPWGDNVGRANANCLDCGSVWDRRSPSPVRTFAANDYGLFDVVGNVAHWTESGRNQSQEAVSACRDQKDFAAIFGASWADPSKYMAVNEWVCFPKVLRDDTIGFRVVEEIDR